MFRNPLWLVIVAFIFIGCGQDTCPTTPKPSVLDFEFQDMAMSHNYMGHTTVFLANGSEARVTRYSQEFANSPDVVPRLGGHTFGVIVSDLQGNTLAESYGVYCGGLERGVDGGEGGAHVPHPARRAACSAPRSISRAASPSVRAAAGARKG
jgi:hypothetical protein